MDSCWELAKPCRAEGLGSSFAFPLASESPELRESFILQDRPVCAAAGIPQRDDPIHLSCRRDTKARLTRGSISRWFLHPCQKNGRHSRGRGPEIPETRSEKFLHPGLGQLLEVVGDLPLGVSPRKVRVGLWKPDLRESVHDLGPGKGFGKENHFRKLSIDLSNHPFPKGKRLGMGIVHPENANSLVNPEKDHVLQFLEKVFPLIGFEIEGIDVFILLGRILSILKRIAVPTKTSG